MAITDTSILANFKTLLGQYINNEAGLSNQFNDDLTDQYIRSGLNEMAIFCNPRYSKLKTESTLAVTAQSANLPADYLHHNISDVLQCTASGNANSFIEFTESREDFVKASNTFSGKNYYILIGDTLKTSNTNVTDVTFEYIRTPAMLVGTTNTADFSRADLYDKLVFYVMAKLFQSEGATVEQKQQSNYFFQQFYQEIGSTDQETQIEKQLDLRTSTNG